MGSKIEKIRSACSIAWAWRILGLPGQPARECKSPFREDKKPSFSVYTAKDGERWYDHGESAGGDVVDFWAKAKDITVQAAIDQLGLMIGEATPPKPAHTIAKEIEWPPDLRGPTELECHSLEMLRGIPAAAFDLAGKLGFLKVGTHKGELLWFLTDASKKGAEGKTFTGEQTIASGKKAAALAGTNKSWGYGLVSTSRQWDLANRIVLVEGLPDFFAALGLAIESPINFRPVAMLGAGSNLGEEARVYFREREALIIPHNDAEGTAATEKWVDILSRFGARVLIQTLPSGKDLNEFLIAPGDENPLDLLKGLA